MTGTEKDSPSPDTDRLARLSIQALAFLEGRSAVRPSDVQRLAVPVLAHRLIVDIKARHGGLAGETVVADALRQEPVPS